MAVRFDFSEIHKSFQQEVNRALRDMETIGQEAVDHAKRTGDYKDRTGHLRASNKSSVSLRGVALYNDAEYADYVESKGYNVCATSALFLEDRLRKQFGK